MAETFDARFPAISWWVTSSGWIEVGFDDYRRSFVRALDGGGMIWESDETFPTVDDAMRALDDALEVWIRENLGNQTR